MRRSSGFSRAAAGRSAFEVQSGLCNHHQIMTNRMIAADRNESMTVLDAESNKNKQETSEDSDMPRDPSSDPGRTIASCVSSDTATSLSQNDPKSVVGLKRSVPVKPDEDDCIVSSKMRRTLNKATDEVDEDNDVVDTAATFCHKDGDRIEVEWDIEGTGEQDEVQTHWWGATLLPFDGRTKDQVAIRTLEYDAHPDGGFPEKSREDVVFLGHNTLADPENMEQVLHYRRAGSEETYGVGDVEPVVNQVLETIMSKNQDAWSKLKPAQQAQIASKIAAKKQKLVELLHQQSGLVTSQDMHAILAQTMNE